MRIVIDMQGAQTESRFRGIARHTLAFAQAVVRNRGEHEIILALSGMFPDTIELIRTAFDGLMPQESIRVWYAPGPLNELKLSDDSHQEVAELMYEAFLNSFKADIIHINEIFDKRKDQLIYKSKFLNNQTCLSAMFAELNENFEKEYESLAERKNCLQFNFAVCIYPGGKISEIIKKNFTDKKTISIEIDLNKLDLAAIEAIKSWQKIDLLKRLQPSIDLITKKKPRLAFVSPLPPERTGIADYSAELIPYLSHYYDIEIVVAQEGIGHSWCENQGRVRDAQWLRVNSSNVDRVLYHIGNSHFHAFMLPLIGEVPGTIVLHDFFLGHLIASLEKDNSKHVWSEALYHSHGYTALKKRHQNPENAIFDYPVNYQLTQNSRGIIVHSEYAKSLAAHWNVTDSDNSIRVVPLLRATDIIIDKTKSREQLGIDEQDLLVCSFGFLGPTKLNIRLINAWLETALPVDKKCHLVFVGENVAGSYGDNLLKIIDAIKYTHNISITGYVSSDLMQIYLGAADLAVQLRTLSRGETSASVLDCMNYGLPIIVNANGSMAEIDPNAVYTLPDEFEDAALSDALTKLLNSKVLRQKLGATAREIILQRHTPDICAREYVEAIESFYSESTDSLPYLIEALAKIPNLSPSDADLKQWAIFLSKNHPHPKIVKCIYLDVTIICNNDLKTGIQRVVRALSLSLLESPPSGYRVELVRLTHEEGGWHYRYARKFTLDIIECPTDILHDEIVEPEAGDVFLALDLTGEMLIQAAQSGLYESYRNQGAFVYAIVYDLLPVRMPDVFPIGADQPHSNWLKAISNFDGAVGISKAVADDLHDWQNEINLTWPNRRPYSIDWFHLGADICSSAPSQGLPKDAEEVLIGLRVRPTFLMVGTIEPRKGYLQTLSAFEILWNEGLDINLVIVGREGWKGWVPQALCRDIPQTISRLKSHSELKNRLFWLEGITDEYLEKIYAVSTCLIAASYGEGFGLPLIEAAQHKLSIIARDIPVFREVAYTNAYYFKADDPSELAKALKTWLALYNVDQHPKSINMHWLTWKESSAQLIKALRLPPPIEHIPNAYKVP
jgi:glycosyltransferase involved in cell wall biosynthesis